MLYRRAISARVLPSLSTCLVTRRIAVLSVCGGALRKREDRSTSRTTQPMQPTRSALSRAAQRQAHPERIRCRIAALASCDCATHARNHRKQRHAKPISTPVAKGARPPSRPYLRAREGGVGRLSGTALAHHHPSSHQQCWLQPHGGVPAPPVGADVDAQPLHP